MTDWIERMKQQGEWSDVPEKIRMDRPLVSGQYRLTQRRWNALHAHGVLVHIFAEERRRQRRIFHVSTRKYRARKRRR